MKIFSLVAENFMRLRAVNIAPGDDPIVTISGKNDQGKTAVVNCLEAALCGAASLPGTPIRLGEKKSRIKIGVGEQSVEFYVERRFTASGSEVVVSNVEGAKFPRPQAMLDAWWSAIALDPEKFSRMKPREQYDALAKIANLDTDLDALEAANKLDFSRRTEISREAKERRAQAAGIEVPPLSDGAEPIDERALVDALQTANDENVKVEREAAAKNTAARIHAQELDGLNRDVERAKIIIHEQQEKIREAEAKIKAEGERISESRNRIAALGPPPPTIDPETLARVDVAAIRRRIDEARSVNSFLADRAAAVARRNEVDARAQELEDQAEDLTRRIDKRKREAEEAVARAVMPVPGLGFGRGEVLYNGVPFNQVGSAMRLRVGMAIAVAGNPPLKVVLIRDGSLIDKDGWEEIRSTASERGYQVWREMVDSSGKMGFVISDGQLVEAP